MWIIVSNGYLVSLNTEYFYIKKILLGCYVYNLTIVYKLFLVEENSLISLMGEVTPALSAY